jgi:hypothetical protein
MVEELVLQLMCCLLENPLLNVHTLLLQATVRKWEKGGTDTRSLELYPDVQSIELAEKLFKTAAQ